MSEGRAIPVIANAALAEPETPPTEVIDYSTIPDHAAERERRLKWSFISSLLTKPLSVVVPVITVPLFLNYLGNERFGLYESVGALTIWLSMSSGGMTLGLINKMTECHVSGDRELARRHVSSLSIALLLSVVFFVLLLTAVVPIIDWQKLLPTGSALARRETPWAVWVSGMITLTGLIFGLPQAIYTGFQEVHRNNIWDAIAKSAALAACVAVVFTPFGLVGVIFAAAGTMTLVRMLNTVVLFTHEKPWLLPHPRYFDRNLLAGSMKQGFSLFVVMTAAMGIFQVDKLIIGHFLGQEAVAQYSVINRPFMLVFSFYQMFLSPLWPAHGEALRRGEVAWAKRAMRLSVAAGCAVIGACGLSMIFFGDTILRVWTRGAVTHAPTSLVLAMTSLFMLWTWMSSISVMLNAAGVLRTQMWVITAHAVLNIILALVLVKPFGVTGVTWSMTISGLFTSVWGYPWILRRHIYSRK